MWNRVISCIMIWGREKVDMLARKCVGLVLLSCRKKLLFILEAKCV